MMLTIFLIHYLISLYYILYHTIITLLYHRLTNVLSNLLTTYLYFVRYTKNYQLNCMHLAVFPVTLLSLLNV